METPKHLQQRILLIESLRHHLRDRPDVYVGGNMGVYFSVTQLKNNDFRAPDFFVAFDVVQDRERKSWVVWEEGGVTPSIVIELVSETTEREDRGRKMGVYARSLHGPEYYLFDPHSLVLEGYRLNAATGTYSNMAPQENGGIFSEKLGLQLLVAPGRFQGVQTDWLRFATPDGVLLPTDDERARAAQASAAQAQADRLADKLRALGINPEE